MVQPADIRALWSGFANISDEDILAQIGVAEKELTAYLVAQGIELSDEGPWSEGDYDHAVALLAAHYLALAHGVALTSSYSYSIGGISESFGAGAKSELGQTVFGQQYLKFLRLKGEVEQSLARTG